MRRVPVCVMIAFGSLSCHRNGVPAFVTPEPVVEVDAGGPVPIESDAGFAVRIVDAGEPEVLSPMVENFSIDVNSDFRVRFARSAGKESRGWQLAVDGLGKVLIVVDTEPYARCTTKQLDKREIAALTNLVQAQSLFVLREFYSGAPYTGMTRLSVHFRKQRKAIRHPWWLASDTSAVPADRSARKRIQAVEQKLIDLVGDYAQIEAPKTFCPADADRVLDSADRL